MLLEEMLNHYSPTGSVEKLADYIVEWANSHGFEARRDAAGNVIARRRGARAGKDILMVGHIDTVPGDIPVRKEGIKLYGRGSVDAKGPMACFLEAASAIEKGNIVVVGTADEEGDSEGARNLLGKFDPLCIIIGEPSGWDRVTLGYKGSISLRYSYRKEKEHGSSPGSGCAEQGILFFNHLAAFCEAYNRGRTLFEQLGMKLSGINSSDDGFYEHLEMAVNFRIPPAFEIGSLYSHIAQARGEAMVAYGPCTPPVKAGKNTRLVQAFIRAIRHAGGNFSFKLKAGTSDMNLLQGYNVPILAYGPGDSRLDHTPHEHIDLEEYSKSVEVLKRVLSAL